MSEASELSAEARDRVEHELARLRAERRTLAASFAGEDPDDGGVGDRGDQAQALEGDDDLARADRRIRELEHLLADPGVPGAQAGLADGTVVTLRFPGAEVATFRVVAVTEGTGTEEVLSTDSPLGRALAGHQPGDTVTYPGPDGELEAELVDLRPPNG